MVVGCPIIGGDQGIVRGEVSFLDQGNFLLSNAKWTVVFNVPTLQFARQISRLRTAIRHLNVGIDRVNRTNYCTEKGLPDLCMTNSLQKESDSMCRAIEDLEKEIYSYHWVQQAGRGDRPRRGLVDIVGKGLKFLFGVADSEDIRAVNYHIGKVEGVVRKTIHYVNIQASLINNMIDNLIETRRAVNQLDNIILSLQLEHSKFSSGLILTHAMHIIELAFDNLWQEWITFRDAIHQLGVG